VATWGDGLGALSFEDQKLIKHSRRALRKVTAQTSPLEIFRALRPCTPVVGGMIGTFADEGLDAMVSHAAGLPTEVLEGWFNSPRDQMLMMLSPLIVARGGQLISDRAAITESMREQLDIWRVLPKVGLGENGGYMVSNPIERPRRRSFLTFALDEGAVFAPHDHLRMEVLRKDLHAALDRICLPLVPSQSITAQIMESRGWGFVLISQKTGRCVEMNMRAREIAARYSASACVLDGRDMVSEFAMRAVFEMRTRDAWIIPHNKGGGELKVTVHELKAEAHAVGEDLWLVMLEETVYPQASGLFAGYGLTPREEEIALMLVESGFTAKDIAEELDTSYNTVRTQIQAIRAKLGVSSRAELVAKVKRRTRK
jgi:DNA-binding CsgD family transcriptional regulator